MGLISTIRTRRRETKKKKHHQSDHDAEKAALSMGANEPLNKSTKLQLSNEFHIPTLSTMSLQDQSTTVATAISSQCSSPSNAPERTKSQNKEASVNSARSIPENHIPSRVSTERSGSAVLLHSSEMNSKQTFATASCTDFDVRSDISTTRMVGNEVTTTRRAPARQQDESSNLLSFSDIFKSGYSILPSCVSENPNVLQTVLSGDMPESVSIRDDDVSINELLTLTTFEDRLNKKAYLANMLCGSGCDFLDVVETDKYHCRSSSASVQSDSSFRRVQSIATQNSRTRSLLDCTNHDSEDSAGGKEKDKNTEQPTVIATHDEVEVIHERAAIENVTGKKANRHYSGNYQDRQRERCPHYGRFDQRCRVDCHDDSSDSDCDSLCGNIGRHFTPG